VTAGTAVGLPAAAARVQAIAVGQELDAHAAELLVGDERHRAALPQRRPRDPAARDVLLGGAQHRRRRSSNQPTGFDRA